MSATVSARPQQELLSRSRSHSSARAWQELEGVVRRQMCPVTRRVSHVTRYASQVTSHTSHVTRYTSYVTRHNTCAASDQHVAHCGASCKLCETWRCQHQKCSSSIVIIIITSSSSSKPQQRQQQQQQPAPAAPRSTVQQQTSMQRSGCKRDRA